MKKFLTYIFGLMNNLITRQKNTLILLSVLIGLLSGLAAIILKNSVHYIELFVLGLGDIEQQNFLYLVLPVIGILLTVLFLKLFIKEDVGHGVSKILQSISRNNGKIKRHNTYSSIVGCSLTVGFGGSAGMEAPILYTGAAIGSNIASLFRQNYHFRVLLIGAGVSGAMAAIFKAPIAGLIFAFEVLMIDLTAFSVIPLVISSVTGAIVSTFLLGKQNEFYFAISEPFVLKNLHWYAVLGIFCALISLYFLYVNEAVEGFLEKIKSSYKRVLIGGVLLGVLIFMFPPLFGEGYTFMKYILSGEIEKLTYNSIFFDFRNDVWIFLLYLFLILVFKVVATSLTTGSGGIGGVFAPSLFMGGIAGAFFAKIINHNQLGNISDGNFTLVGMAGLIAGVIHAPLTAIFLIAEITGGYELFIPLILTASISYLVVNIFRPHSIYTKKLAQKGELITHDKDKAVLTLLKVDELIETDFVRINAQGTLRDLVQAISISKRNIFPVTDTEGHFLGVVAMDDVRKVMFDTEQYDTLTIRELMTAPPDFVYSTDTMEQVMEKFNITGFWNLPVLQDGKYAGFVSRSNVFNYYRQKLVEFTQG